MKAPVGALVVGAGDGRRFGGPKQSVVLGGQTVLERSVAAARSVAGLVVAVVQPQVAADPVAGADLVVAGGTTRSASVRAGLVALCGAAHVTVVVVHDAARPLAPAALFQAVVHAVIAGADGAVPVLEVVDTLKLVRDGVVTRTVPREGLCSVQTPQAFRAAALLAAYEGESEASDDAALVERAGGKVVALAGDPCNLKLTAPGDLRLAEALVAASAGGDKR